MTVIKERVPLEAQLVGDGRHRRCRVRVCRYTTYADESEVPTAVSYSRCELEDADDFPDGNYELSFDSHRIRLRKQAGHYGITSET